MHVLCAVCDGGGSHWHVHLPSLDIIFQSVVNAAAGGETLPLWGTCLGFELTSFLASGLNPAVPTGPFDAENLTIALNFTDAAAGSRLWGNAPASVVAALSSSPSTINMHRQGVTPEQFQLPLLQRLRVLSTNTDRAGRAFVSSAEGVSLPVFITQFHPEKVVYEWTLAEPIPHDYPSIAANSYRRAILLPML